MMDKTSQERLRTLIEEMRAGLDGVTQGPWGFEDDVNPHLVTAGRDADGAYLYVDSDVDVRHIARCSPDNIRLLLDAAGRSIPAEVVAALEEALEMLRAASRILSKEHRVVLGGKVWGSKGVLALETAIRALQPQASPTPTEPTEGR